ncbi:MAG TPA: DNA internalization-related competence protein ComEC/Rec2 [Patescibacteria group bacterium]|nr:DNA internalization-related competence protein ComEC/Rec2 [Patescibacteria group bacterium]
MGVAQFALPAALAGVAAGILASDLGLAPEPIAALAAGAVLTGLAGLLRGRAWAVAMVGVALLGVAAGTWRHAATDRAAIPPERSVATLVDGAEHRLIGTVADDPRPRADRLQLVLREVRVERDGAAHELEDRLLVWLPRGVDARAGVRLRLEAELELAEDFDGFAYREHLARQGIGAIARVRGAEVAPASGGPAVAMAALRGMLLGGLNDLVPEPEAALGAGILLGVRTSIAPEINDDFAAAGLTHVVAISGWNIAIVTALVLALVRPLERRPGGRWTTPLIAASAVGGYVILTGASPSVVRAALMAGAMLVGRFGGSRAHATSALGLAALVMLLVAPAVLWDVGFQLSLLATAGLIWYGRGIEGRLRRWPPWLREPVALTIAAQLTTLPVILVNFERLSLVAPLSNVLVVPIVPLAMLTSAGASVGGILAGTVDGAAGDLLAWLLGGAAWLVLRAMVLIGQLSAAIPLASVEASVPAPFAVAWYPLLALAGWATRREAAAEPRPVVDEAMTGAMAALARLLRPVPAAALLVVVLGAITIGTAPDGRLHVITLDIGQGDAILVRTPNGRTMLIDGGPDPELTLRRLGANLPFHARRIDLVVLSHPHQDHVAGLVEVIDRFEVGAVLHAGIGFDNAAYDRLLTDAAEAGIPTRLARAGAAMALDATTMVEVLYPSEADAALPLPEGDINNGSVVLLLRHDGFAALLTGDAEAPVEAALVSRGLEPIDLLKVGHHGSTSSTTPGLLAAARPSVAVISSGEGNEYGHPAPETLAALRSVAGLSIHRTDLEGDVEVVSGTGSYRVRTDAGWAPSRPTHRPAVTGSIGPWPFPTERPSPDCSTRPSCPTASASTPRASLASRWRRPGWWWRAASRSTAGWSRRRHCSTTSTSPRFGAVAASTASSARAASRRRGTRSSRCRSPPTRSPLSSTTIASRSAGRRCWWPWPTGTWHRRSSPSTSGSTT